jgi:hypothetical protein
MPINTGSFSKALYPGLKKWFGTEWEDHAVEYTQLFDVETSNRAFEELMSRDTFGLHTVKPEGVGVDYDTMSQEYLTRFQHITYAKGFIITREMVEDDLYDIAGKRMSKDLARTARLTREKVASLVYERSANSSYVGGDGEELLHATHPHINGPSYSNILSGTPNLSEAALEDISIQIMQAKDSRGNQISLMPKTLIITPDNVFEADRILNSPLRVGTADNDLNALKNMGKFPGGVVVNHYISNSSDDWWVRTNAADGMIMFNRRADSFTDDNDFDTDNAKYKCTGRYSCGWGQPRAVYGSKD